MKRFEFDLGGEVFCVQDVEGLCERMAVTRDTIPILCHWLSTQSDDLLELVWHMLRRLYGIGPAIPAVGSLKDDDYVPSTLEEVSARFNYPVENIVKDLVKIRARWVHEMKTNPDTMEEPKKRRGPGRPKSVPPPDEAPAPAQPTLPVPDSARVSDAELAEIESVIVRYGFTMEMFNLAMREEQHRRVEARWFGGRLTEIQKLFEEVSTKTLARQAIINEMHMRRIDDEMARLPPLNAKFWQYQDAKIKLEEIYSSQWSQIEKLNPALRSQQTKRAFAGVVSEIIEGIREYQSDPNNEIADGVFTALELQVEMRSSKQQGGDVQYRPDIVAAINEARRSIWDPKFKRRLEDKHLRLIGFAFHEAVKAFTEKTGIAIPDLASDNGEHPALYIPSPEESSAAMMIEDAPIVPPEEPVKIV